MAYIGYNNLWENEFDNNVSKNDEVKDLKNNQLKLQVHDTNNKDEKITTNFKAVDGSDNIIKAYLDEKLIKKRWSFIVFRKRLQRV